MYRAHFYNYRLNPTSWKSKDQKKCNDYLDKLQKLEKRAEQAIRRKKKKKIS